MKIAFASDHGGLELKNAVKLYLDEKGHETTDFGTYTKAATIPILPAARLKPSQTAIAKKAL